MLVQDQSDICTFLTGLTDPGAPPPERIETHISIVFLHPDRVFKLKKAVRLPYLDFSTAAKRLHYCRRELALNRRTAPQIYRAVHKIVRKADGTIGFSADDDTGELIDAVLEMTRFDQDCLLDRLAQRGPLEPMLIDALAVHIADFHSSANVRSEISGSVALAHAQEANENGFADTFLAHDDTAMKVLALCRRMLERESVRLDARARAGFVRHCHGDLHLRNICLFDGTPVLFDCLEFDDELASIDVLYDLAFLLMDMWRVGQREAANRLYNRYLDIAGDVDALGLLPLFMAMRACVRSHVTAAQAEGLKGSQPDRQRLIQEAGTFVSLARAFTRPAQPMLIAIGGLSGSGKSTAAAGIAPLARSVPGARVLSSDRIRKALWGARPLDRLPQEAYARQISTQVYARQRDEALRVLRGGASVIADAVFLNEDERQAIAGVAREAGVRFEGVWLEAPEHRLVDRVTARQNDPSDATAEVIAFQAERSGPVTGWTQVDASGRAEETLAGLCRALGLQPD